MDTTRADHLGCYGYPLKTTPNIDKLAGESLLFRNAIAQAPYTCWSVPSFLSSQYPQKSSAAQRITIADALSNEGFKCGAVISNVEMLQVQHLREGFDYYDTSNCFADISSPSVCTAGMRWIDSVKDGRFFLFMLFMTPYTVCRARGFRLPQECSPRHEGGCCILVNYIDNATLNRDYAGRDYDTPRALYDSEIAFTDSYICTLIGELRKRNLYENTLIVFLADHGEEFGDHGGVFHGKTLYQEVLHVPLLIKLPGERQKKEVDGVFPLVDLVPSLINFLGYDASCAKPQGMSIDLTSLRNIPEQDALSASEFEAGVRLRSVQDSRYKYILDLASGNQKLFDLSVYLKRRET